MYSELLAIALSLLAITPNSDSPVYSVPGQHNNITEDLRLNEVAGWALGQAETPTILELRWQLATRGISLEQVTAFYLHGPESPEKLLAQLNQARPKPPAGEAPFLLTGSACQKKAAENYCVLLAAQGILAHESFPAAPKLTEQLIFSATLPSGYKQPELWIIKPDGSTLKVHINRPQANKINATVATNMAGIHQFELMATGPQGPVVLLNVPIFWGVNITNTLPPWLGKIAWQSKAKATDDQLLALINSSRRYLGLQPLVEDERLTDVARHRAMAMAQKGEFAHLGDGDERPEIQIRAQGLNFARMSENIAHAADVWSAHYLLMTSPTHRLALINPQYSHIGIGIAHRPTDYGSELFIVEELANILPEYQEDRLPDEIIALINDKRLKARLPLFKQQTALNEQARQMARQMALGEKTGPLATNGYDKLYRDSFLIGNRDDILKSANIMGPHEEIGIGIAPGAGEQKGQFWVILLFGDKY